MIDAVSHAANKPVLCVLLLAVLLVNIVGAFKLYRFCIENGGNKSEAVCLTSTLFFMWVMIPLGWYLYWVSWKIEKLWPSCPPPPNHTNEVKR